MTAPPAQRVLVVEDDPDIGQLLTHYLQKAGFEPTLLTSGRDVLARARREAFDVILLDIMLPGLDGLQVCRALRADPGTAQVPIIMLTAKGEEPDRIVGLELGADDYITKPFSPERGDRAHPRLAEARAASGHRRQAESSTVRCRWTSIGIS